jgi:hypothetical protein
MVAGLMASCNTIQVQHAMGDECGSNVCHTFREKDIETGHIRGIVKNDKGERIAGACIVIEGDSIDLNYVLHSAEDGTFVAPVLYPGQYKVTIALYPACDYTAWVRVCSGPSEMIEAVLYYCESC